MFQKISHHPFRIFVAGILAMIVAALLSEAARADLGPNIGAPAPGPAPAAPARDEALRKLTVEQRPMAEITAPQSDLAVKAWVDHQDNVYRPGDNLQLFVQANQDAYITVIDVGTSGKVHIVYPNTHSPDSFVRAGSVLAIPGTGAGFDFKVGGPAGSELLKVIATRKPVALFKPDDLTMAGPYKAVKGSAAAIAKDLSVVLSREPAGWAEYAKVFQIVDTGPAVTAAAPVPPPAPPVAIQGTAPLSAVQVLPPSTGAFRLSLATDKPSYRIGEKALISVATERDCRLTLLNAGSSGRITVLFPNRYQPENLLRSGQSVQVPGATAPFDFRATGPGGIESLIAVCRTDDTPLFTATPYDFRQQPFIVAGETNALLKDLAVTLNQPGAALAHAATSFLISP